MSLNSPLLQNVDNLYEDDYIASSLEKVEDENNNDENESTTKTNIFDIKLAKSYAIIYSLRGVIGSAHIFFFSSLITLAEKAAGCNESEDDDTNDNDECTSKVYGIKPSSLLTIISMTSSITVCIISPISGAIVDFTPYRKQLGIVTGYMLVLISAIFIGTVESTWFYMSLLYAIAAFIAEAQTLATFSYLPEIARMVNDNTMTSFSTTFSMLQFTTMLVFILTITGISIGFRLNDTVTSQISQSLAVILLTCGYTEWYQMPHVEQRHKLPDDTSIITAGFSQNWRTFKGIHRYYGDGLQWILISNAFGSAGAKALGVVYMTFLKDRIGLSSSELGIVYLIMLVHAFPGAKIGSTISKKLHNPISSLKVLYSVFIPCILISAIVPEDKYIAYFFAAIWGICFGWFYPTSNLIFSLSIPKGQEAELTGFYIYSGYVVDWLPPLCFTLLNEAGFDMKWGIMSIALFLGVALVCLFPMAEWSTVRECAMERSKMSFD